MHEYVDTNQNFKEKLGVQNNDLGVNLAIGSLTLYLTIALLCFLNRFIYLNYSPDVKAAVAEIISRSIMAKKTFLPEPVERLQFQLSVICAPFFIFIAFTLIKRLKNVLYNRPSLTFFINVIALNIFIVYLYIIFQQKLINFEGTSSFFFNNNLISKYSLIFGLFFYGIVTYYFFLYAKIQEHKHKKIIISIISYEIVALVLFHIIMGNVFHVSEQDIVRILETNAVFYSVTQVLAGKSLLVDLNCQYGLYAWFLYPLFKITGLTISKFTITLAILNACSFLFIYLGLKRIIKQDIIPLIIFLAFIFWQYWQVKLPFEATPRFYYQYWPIRFLFPSVSFFLITVYYTGGSKTRKNLLPVLAFISSFSILWNFDSGFVVYTAVFLSLLFTAFAEGTLRNSIKKCLTYTFWMLGALSIVFAFFIFSTIAKSGRWPDFKHFLDFQQIFYISGYYMMPMSVVHFWNLPVLVYLVAGVYCVFNFRKKLQNHIPVLIFLLVLGFGLFAYFQGRSWDSTIMIVMYPAIIITGIFCDKLLMEIIAGKLRFHVSVALFAIAFIFLADGAFSMLGYIPSLQTYTWKNAFPERLVNAEYLNQRNDFITNNIPKNDTVIILSNNFESYYYALGNYYNPVNIPSSTEIFLKSEVYLVLDAIKKGSILLFTTQYYRGKMQIQY